MAETIGNFHIFEIRCTPIKKVLNILDHYFLIYNNHEYHLGFFKKGNILPLNTTKQSYLVGYKIICGKCLQKFLHDLNYYEDRRLCESFYPLINCETLILGFSYQSSILWNLIFLLPIILYSGTLFLFIFLMFIIFSLLYFKPYYRKMQLNQCMHF